MVGTCENLVTKKEFEELKKQLDLKPNENKVKVLAAYVVAAATAGLTAKIGTLGEEVQTAKAVGQTATRQIGHLRQLTNQAKSTANVARLSSTAAQQAANKAKFEALYAQTRASSAAATAARNTGSITKALGQIGSLFSLIGTFATLGAVAALAANVAELSNKLKSKEASDKVKFRLLENQIKTNTRYFRNLEKSSVETRAIVDKNKEFIESLKQDYAKTKKQVEENIKKLDEQKIELLQFKIESTANNNSIKAEIKKIKEQIAALRKNDNSRIKSDLAKLKTQIADALSKNQDILSRLQNDFKSQQEQLFRSQAQQTFNRLEQFKQQGIVLETRTRKLGERITLNDTITSGLKNSQINLGSRLLDESKKLENQQITLESKLLEESKKLENQNISLQSKLLEESQKLENNRVQLQNSLDKATVPFQKQLTKFEQQLNAFKNPATNPATNPMNDKQFETLNKKLEDLYKQPRWSPTEIAIAVGTLPILQQILNKKNPVSPCQAPVLVPPVAAQTKVNHATILGFQATALGQNAVIQNSVNAVQNTVNTVSPVITNTYNVVNKGWQSVFNSRVLQVMNTVFLIHNMMMLSRNIGSTVGDAIGIGLNAIGINDGEGNPIDVNTIVGNKIQALLASLIGEENYVALTNKIAANNRILMAGQNVMSLINSISMSARELDELTGENVAKIGNALRESGSVDYDSYPPMQENLGFGANAIDKLQKLDEVADTAYQITDEANEISEDLRELGNARTEWNDALEAAKQANQKAEARENAIIENMPVPTDTDIQQSTDS